MTIEIYRNTDLPVLCGCETWSRILREENTMRMFENKKPRNTYGPTQTSRTQAPVHNEKLALFTNRSTVLK